MPIILFSVSEPAFAGNYFIAPNGSDSGGDGTSTRPWQSLERISQKIKDNTITCGDTVYAKGGMYNSTSDYLDIRKKCAQDNKLTIRNNPGETPIFNSNGRLVYQTHIIHIIGAEHIVFDGLHFSPEGSTDLNALVGISGNHIEIKNCLLEGGEDPTPEYFPKDYNASRIININGDFNYIHHNIIRRTGDTSPGYNKGYLFVLANAANFNRISENHLSEGYHDCGSIFGEYNEYVNNIVNPAAGHGILTREESDYNLIEGNLIAGADWNETYVKNGIFMKGNYTIVRRNIVWHDPTLSDPGTNPPRVGDTAIAQYRGDNNKFYNNVFFGMDRGGMKLNNEGSVSQTNNTWLNNVAAGNSQQASYCFETDLYNLDKEIDYWNPTDLNTFKNNFVMKKVGGVWQDNAVNVHRITQTCNSENDKTVSWMEENYPAWSDNVYSSAGCPGLDPKFTNPSSGDFSISADSCLRDKGRWLTLVAGDDSASGTNLKVDDAAFFWFSNFDNRGDQIIIDGDSAKIRTITAIDHANNILTLDSSVSRSPGNSKIYLYKSFLNPDTVLFSGSAPDIGAFEFISSNKRPNPPTQLRKAD